MRTESLKDLLDESSHAQLLRCARSDERTAELRSPRGIEGLLAVMRSIGSPPRRRMLAAEVLFAFEPGFPPVEDARLLPAIYAHALAEGGDGGPWGAPGLWEGTATTHWVGLGRDVLSELLPLLSNDRRLRYTGSQRATLGEVYGIRVKDVAVHVASTLLGVPFTLYRDPRARDARARELAASVGAP